MPKLPRSTSSATSSMASGTIPSRPAKPHPDRLKIMHLFPDRPLGSTEGLVGRGELQTFVGSFLSDLDQRLAVITAPGTECGTMEREAHALVSQAGILGLAEL